MVRIPFLVPGSLRFGFSSPDGFPLQMLRFPLVTNAAVAIIETIAS